MGGASGLHVFQGNASTGMFGVDRATEENVAVEDPDLADIAWIVADGDRLADISGEHGIEEAQTLKMDTVAAEPPLFALNLG